MRTPTAERRDATQRLRARKEKHTPSSSRVYPLARITVGRAQPYRFGLNAASGGGCGVAGQSFERVAVSTTRANDDKGLSRAARARALIDLCVLGFRQAS